MKIKQELKLPPISFRGKYNCSNCIEYLKKKYCIILDEILELRRKVHEKKQISRTLFQTLEEFEKELVQLEIQFIDARAKRYNCLRRKQFLQRKGYSCFRETFEDL